MLFIWRRPIKRKPVEDAIKIERGPAWKQMCGFNRNSKLKTCKNCTKKFINVYFINDDKTRYHFSLLENNPLKWIAMGFHFNEARNGIFPCIEKELCWTNC